MWPVHKIAEANVEIAGRPIARDFSEGLRRNWSHGTASTATAKSAPTSRHPHKIHSQFQSVAAAFGFDLISAFLEIIAANGPAVFPEQRTDVHHTTTATIEIGFVMTRKFLHAIAEIHQAEVAKPDEATARGRDQLAAAFDH